MISFFCHLSCLLPFSFNCFFCVHLQFERFEYVKHQKFLLAITISTQLTWQLALFVCTKVIREFVSSVMRVGDGVKKDSKISSKLSIINPRDGPFWWCHIHFFLPPFNDLRSLKFLLRNGPTLFQVCPLRPFETSGIVGVVIGRIHVGAV